ncbi:hypothetical protein [Micromonospora sp. IBSANI012]|uniref:hypothetical protein n=1 Tax=Micromonospora sp. IBSANI012 TaxID=3457761 RepID=UPI00405A4A8E
MRKIRALVGATSAGACAITALPAAVLAELGPNKRFNVRNNAGTTDVVMDVVGRFYWP